MNPTLFASACLLASTTLLGCGAPTKTTVSIPDVGTKEAAAKTTASKPKEEKITVYVVEASGGG